MRSLFPFQNLNNLFSRISKSLAANEGWALFSSAQNALHFIACLSQGLAQCLHRHVVYFASCYVRFKEVVDLNEFCILNPMKTI